LSNIVEIRDLNFDYESSSVIKGLSMDFARGKVVSIMGGSGSGKTTILKLIAGLLPSNSESIFINNHDITKFNSKELFKMRRQMGMLFQNGALFTDLTIFENVAFPIRENTNLDEKLLNYLVLMKLNAVGLLNAASLMPSEISGGMARRVALARAIALDPKLIMYDEPFAGLDPISMGVIANLIRNLNDALDLTSILVSHDINETFAISDYVYFILHGQLIAHGTPENMKNSKNPFVEQFVSAKFDGPVPFHLPGEKIKEKLKFS